MEKGRGNGRTTIVWTVLEVMLKEKVCFQCRFDGFNGRYVADMERKTVALSCCTVTKKSCEHML